MTDQSIEWKAEQYDRLMQRQREREKRGAYWLTPDGRRELRKMFADANDGNAVMALLDEVERLEALRLKAVYVVSETEDEGSRLRGVYTTAAMANRAADYFVADYVEAVELDNLPEHPAGKLAWQIEIDRQGHIKRRGRIDGEAMKQPEPRWRALTDNCMWVRVWGTDPLEAQYAAEAYKKELEQAGTLTWHLPTDRENWQAEYRKMHDELYSDSSIIEHK